MSVDLSKEIEQTKRWIDLLKEAGKSINTLVDSVNKKAQLVSPQESKSIAELTKKIALLETQLKKKTKVEKEQNQQAKELVRLQKEQEKATQQRIKQEEKLTAINSGRLDEQIKLNQANAQALKERKLFLAEQQKGLGTTQKLELQNKRLRLEREKLNLSTEKGRRRLEEINKTLDKNNKFIKSNSDALKKQRLSVGSYTDGIKSAISETGLFAREISILQKIQTTLNATLGKNRQEQEATSKALGGSAKATRSFSKSLRVLKVALIGTGIGAIVVALGALIGAFASTQKGADVLAKAMRPLSVIFEKFVGFLQDKALKAFDNLGKAIDNPKQAFLDLANVIKDNLLKRFEAIGKIAPALGRIFKGEITQGLKDLGNAALQAGTGVEDVIDKVGGTAESIGKEIDIANQQADRLSELIIQLERREIDLTIPLAEANLEFQKFRAIASDQTKSDQERIEALKEAEKQQRFISASAKELLDLEIERVELEQSFNDTSREEELELAKLKARRLTEESNAQKKINALISLRSGLEKKLNKDVGDRTQTLEDNLKISEKTFELNELYIAQNVTNEEEAQIQILEAKRDALEEEIALRESFGEKIIKQKTELLLLEKEIEDSKNSQSFESQLEQIERTNKEKIKALIGSAESEEEILSQSFDNEIERLDALIELYDKFGKDTIDLEIEKQNKINAEKERADAEDLERRKKNQEAIIELGEQLVDKAIDQSRRISEQKQKELEDEISNAQDRQKELFNIANSGTSEASQIAAQAIEEEAQREREKTEELRKEKNKQVTLEATLTGLKVLGAQAGQPNALPKTLADVAGLLTGIIGLIPSFEVGTEMTDSTGRGVDGKGGFHAILHDKERVMDKENNLKTVGLSNTELADVGQAYLKGELVNKQTIVPQQQIEVKRFQSNEELIQEFRKLRTAFENQEYPEHIFDYDPMLKAIEHREVRKGKIRRNFTKI